MSCHYLQILVRHVALDETTAETQEKIGDFLNLLGIVGDLFIVGAVETFLELMIDPVPGQFIPVHFFQNIDL